MSSMLNNERKDPENDESDIETILQKRRRSSVSTAASETETIPYDLDFEKLKKDGIYEHHAGEWRVSLGKGDDRRQESFSWNKYGFYKALEYAILTKKGFDLGRDLLPLEVSQERRKRSSIKGTTKKYIKKKRKQLGAFRTSNSQFTKSKVPDSEKPKIEIVVPQLPITNTSIPRLLSIIPFGDVAGQSIRKRGRPRKYPDRRLTWNQILNLDELLKYESRTDIIPRSFFHLRNPLDYKKVDEIGKV